MDVSCDSKFIVCHFSKFHRKQCSHISVSGTLWIINVLLYPPFGWQPHARTRKYHLHDNGSLTWRIPRSWFVKDNIHKFNWDEWLAVCLSYFSDLNISIYYTTKFHCTYSNCIIRVRYIKIAVTNVNFEQRTRFFLVNWVTNKLLSNWMICAWASSPRTIAVWPATLLQFVLQPFRRMPLDIRNLESSLRRHTRSQKRICFSNHRSPTMPRRPRGNNSRWLS